MKKGVFREQSPWVEPKNILATGTSLIKLRIVEKLICIIWALFILQTNRTNLILDIGAADSVNNLTGDRYDKRHRYKTL